MNSNFLMGFADELVKVSAPQMSKKDEKSGHPYKASKKGLHTSVKGAKRNPISKAMDSASRAGGKVERAAKGIKKKVESPGFKQRVHDYKTGRYSGYQLRKKHERYGNNAPDTARQIASGAKNLTVGSAKAAIGASGAAGKGAYHAAKGVGKGIGAGVDLVSKGAKKVTDSDAGKTGLGAVALALLGRKLWRR